MTENVYDALCRAHKALSIEHGRLLGKYNALLADTERQRAADALLQCALMDSEGWPEGCIKGDRLVIPIPINVCRDHGTRYLRAAGRIPQPSARPSPGADEQDGEIR